ncbi:MAG: molybdopterin cofactor-binding domain-containing protein [Aestuariivirgaceae bacterium]
MRELTIVSRRDFLASGAAFGGGLLLAASLPGLALSQTVIRSEHNDVAAGFKPSAYIEIGSDGRITFTIGKSEMGQGTLTGIAQLIADELACDWQQVRIVQATAAPAFGLPANGFMVTGGSTGLRSEWMRMRTMGAAARMMLQRAAAANWNVDFGALVVADSVVTAPDGKRAGFAELADAASKLEIPGKPPLKPAADRTVIGKSVKRLDTLQKTTGRAEFGIDIEVPGMLTGVVVSPPQLMAPVRSFNGEKALARPGVSSVVQISTGIAIVGDHYWAVHAAREDVEIEWGDSPFAGVGMDQLRDGYGKALATPGRIAETKGDVAAATGGHSITREFEQPYLAHACMEPMNFTVWIKPDSAEVWGPTQAQSWVQQTVGKVAGIDPAKVTVHTTFLGGGFGRRSALDFVEAAAEVAKAVGKPVKLVYSREDDMRAGRYRPFNLTRATAALDEAGNLAALDVTVAVPSVAKWSGAVFLIGKDGIDKQAVEGLVNLPYDIANLRVEWVDHDPMIPVHFWRSVGSSHNPFVVETLLDELAAKAGSDPLDFRRRLLRDSPRHLAVLDQLAREANWRQPAADGTGRGMAIVESFGSIVAEAAELRLVDGAPKVEQVTCVIDCGVAVNPGQIEAQMQSSIVYGLSAFLRGEITLSDGAVEQSNFHDYEPLRMPEMPRIKVRIIEGGDRPGGVGEPGLPPVLPAVANAIASLNGRRVTRLPYRG